MIPVLGNADADAERAWGASGLPEAASPEAAKDEWRREWDSNPR